ncbi:MAG: hypothetical protein GY820_31265, partial [Gammaproteobacteria bacterium]|nr:hypothetical protein [Gammaproteobacteria bacterium]
QQQQQQRNQGPPPYAQNQNWGPSNQNQNNSQQGSARGSGQSSNAGYGRGGKNQQGYNNTSRNSGYNTTNQQGYSNPQRGQSNYSTQQNNRPSNMGNRQPQYQQGPQTGYGVRTLQINPDGLNVGGVDDDTLDPNPEEIDLSGQDQYAPTGSQDEHYIESKYNGGHMIYPDDGPPEQAQNYVENLPVQNQNERNVQIFSQTTSRDNFGGDSSVREMMGKMLNLMSENQQKMDYNSRESDRKLAELDDKISRQGFQFSYEGGQIPQKDGEHVQTNSDMGHSKSRASLGMHDIACECSKCLLEKIAKIAQA